MNITRFMNEELIELDFVSEQEPPPENSESVKWKERNKEQILSDLVTILDRSGKVVNRNKILIDFINRERKATTAIGLGVAIPHVRSMQAKDFVIGIARSHTGYEFDSLDGEPTNLFFVMAAPPYDDNFYLKVFKELSSYLQYEDFRRELLNAEYPYDIIRAFKSME
ncbi:MAG: PTS sugar transporter subunit IIA [candidate division Zixibacteria bacterium]|nr:PTS sugar transporter subunit IIA [candidate division Zixibacteria bacterium]